MTRDDITRMAREAGFVGFDGDTKRFRQFANIVAAAEREACAKVCEADVERPSGYSGQWEGYGKFKTKMTGPECAATIRARGNNV